MDRVIGSDGEPATTTTSSLAPFPAFLALRFLRCLFCLINTYATPPIETSPSTILILFVETQSWTRASIEAEAADSAKDRGGGGGRGRADSGSHGAVERASLRAFEARSRCLST